MPRQPKNKAVEAAKPSAAVVPIPVAAAPAAPKITPVIDVDNFIRVRDSVYQRLGTIQELIKSFSQDYLRQTNLLLGEGTNLENGLDLDPFGSLMQANFSTQQPAVEEKKERKKRTHDPNAPKRPLTPYFLYMQTARPIIASDLGEEAPKGAVQEEGQRRWSVMNATEKAGWNTAYQYNLRLYNARVHSYKHGNPEAKNMTDDDALKYAEEYSIEMPTTATVEDPIGNDNDAIAQQLQESAVVEEASDDEPAPTAKTPKKGKDTRKRKTATPAATEIKPVEITQTPVSPEAKKRKRTSKAADLVEEPKKSGRKKAKA
ncbi:hypothetical protein B0H67DRAFT_561615 [Lasiosphaeris hirsuta]|uniref:HMG box domain-containing protein n=1 Tax=Lasiosphaeris hirsuta TaxID=260670 RepID=A0AA40BA27_9PEZI|nr:hypothetical protein B0H67DRAFT_561615 [Lasiosphaeris hirsuta]